jgi:hypothetical protein
VETRSGTAWGRGWEWVGLDLTEAYLQGQKASK